MNDLYTETVQMRSQPRYDGPGFAASPADVKVGEESGGSPRQSCWDRHLPPLRERRLTRGRMDDFRAGSLSSLEQE